MIEGRVAVSGAGKGAGFEFLDSTAATLRAAEVAAAEAYTRLGATSLAVVFAPNLVRSGRATERAASRCMLAIR